ncbi:MAG: hypothetical protein O7G85_10190 [Planctomycetota bacterium]|nr:hypothetical protein [Planctomycetota bacterium]
MLAFSIPFLLVVIGAILIWSGRAAKLKDDHWRCARCLYDLTGIEETYVKCSECGADLQAKKSQVRGRCPRRFRQLWGGFVMLAIGITILTMQTLVASGRMEWIDFKPDWWLRLETGHGNLAVAQGAWYELALRTNDGRLTSDQVLSLYDEVMALQADRSATWNVCAGEFAHAAVDSGYLEIEDARRYFIEGIEQQVTVVNRAKIHPGDELPIELQAGGYRFGVQGRGMSSLMLQLRPESIQLPGEEPRELNRPYRMTTLSVRGLDLKASVPIEVKTIGPISANLVVEARVLGERMNEQTGKLEDVVWASWRQTSQIDFEIVPEDQPLVTLQKDVTMAEAIREAIFLDLVNIKIVHPIAGQAFKATPTRAGFVALGAAPANLAFDIVGRDGESEVLLKQQVVLKGKIDMGWFLKKDIREYFPNSDSNSIDVIFRTNPKLAKQNPQMDSVWDGEIVFKDVPIRPKETASDSSEE